MTLRHMKIFVAVYQQKSITLASNSLHLAQPSVSLAIKELEEYYQDVYKRQPRRERQSMSKRSCASSGKQRSCVLRMAR